MSPGCETSVSLSFIASATDCSFDAICHYLKLKILFVYGNDYSSETACLIWKIIGRSADTFLMVVVVVADLLILPVEIVVYISECLFSKMFTWL